MLDNSYKDWLQELKQKVRSAQLKAALAVNAELIEFYFELGKSITEKQTAWGTKFLKQLSGDLRKEFPNMEGFSETNLKYCRLFFQYIQNSPQVEDKIESSIRPQTEDELQAAIGQQAVDQLLLQRFVQIPWGHINLIINKIKNAEEALFYNNKTIEHGWSRNILGIQIKSQLYARQGKAINNFNQTLPIVTSDLAHQLLKDPYKFDFLSLTENYKERELENALVENITKFLLELGSGFAYVGKQVPMKVGDQEYFIDLLFYHLKLRSYVVIELKATDFQPEYAGKLSFYLSAANDLLRHPNDNPTIGLMICKNKNNIVAEYALNSINHPIGVSEYELTKLFPEEFKSSLPTIEEIENELKDE
jgi:predicted nuclease of restriction endonuclease-like (RecB) superfamily